MKIFETCAVSLNTCARQLVGCVCMQRASVYWMSDASACDDASANASDSDISSARVSGRKHV